MNHERDMASIHRGSSVRSTLDGRATASEFEMRLLCGIVRKVHYICTAKGG